MEGLRVVIVDDSPFSIAVIRGILEDQGIEVVGEASSLEEVKVVVAETRPTLVTMDMTLPGTDGLECTRAIHKIDKTVKIIIISAMMDDEIIKESKKSNASAYLQKPVEADSLITTIQRIVNSEELFLVLENDYPFVFKESLLDALNKMTKTRLHFKTENSYREEHLSNGLTIIMGIIGRFSGRMFIDLTMQTATEIARAVLKREPAGHEEIVSVLGEFSNIVSGNACSILNRGQKAFGLRVAPPTIMHGEQVHITAPSYKTFTAVAETSFGEIVLNVGFQRGDDHWM